MADQFPPPNTATTARNDKNTTRNDLEEQDSSNTKPLKQNSNKTDASSTSQRRGFRSNFQFHQIPVPSPPPSGSSGSRRGGSPSSNTRTVFLRGIPNGSFLSRFRSQSSIPECVGNGHDDPEGSSRVPLVINPHQTPQNHQHHRGRSASSSSFLPQVPTSTSLGGQGQQGQGQDYYYYDDHQGQEPSVKPKKWFSFTNLWNRQTFKSSLLNISAKGRLSVSSTLNSVFIGPISPTPSEVSSSGGGGGVFFGGGGGGIDNPAVSHSPNRHSYPGSDPNPNSSVVYRLRTNSKSDQRHQPPPQVRRGSGPPTGGGCGPPSGNRQSGSSDRSYYTGQSSSISGGSGSSRLSCGEFFTGTPNSPVLSSSSGGGGGGVGGGDVGIISRDPEFFVGGGGRRDFYNCHKSLGKSLPTLLESMESGIASQTSCSEEGGGGSYQSMPSSPISVDSVIELLHQEYAILTGAKSLDDHYILTFPDRGNFQFLGDEGYRRLMIYLTAVAPVHDAESGFVIIVDRRNDKWNSVKSTLVRISNYFPGLIHRVFVLRPVGIFQKALSEISSKLFRTENLRFRLTVCNSLSDLHAYVDVSQLTLELGGWIYYDKVKWVQERIEVEGFHRNLQGLSRSLKAFTEGFTDLEYPNDVGSTELLISEKHSEFGRLRAELRQAMDHGEHLLFRIKDCSVINGSSSSTSNGHQGQNGKSSSSVTSSSSVQLINVISVERYIIQVEETTRLFEEFWLKEKQSLEQCLQLRRFEQDFREMQAIFDLGMSRISQEFLEVGETLSSTDQLIKETLTFEKSSAEDVSRAQELERIGREIVESNQSAVDSVEPKCLELNRMVTQFQTCLRDRINKQQEWRGIQEVIEKANVLCNEGMELMSEQILNNQEDSVDGGGALLLGSCGQALMGRLDNFLERIRTMAEDLNKFKSTLGSPTHSQSKPLVKQVLKRVEDVETMCIKRRGVVAQQIMLQAAAAASKPKSRRSSGSSFASSTKSSDGGSSQNSSCELKSARSTSQLDCNIDDPSGGGLGGGGASFLLPLMMRSAGGSTLSLDGHGHGGSSSKIGISSSSEWELKRIKRAHVLNELLQTEKTYVEEIGEILTGYRDQLTTNSEFRLLLPNQLQPVTTPSAKLQVKENPNVGVVFCNLEEIHEFHRKTFLPDLSNCLNSLELLGLCFIQRHAEFLSMYSQYCQLLPASEGMRKEIGENHAWFVACRNRLGHKLPLGAYLLKPVQRVTKYHLLLKDLVKSSEGCDGHAELLEALECMLVVLRCVNDGMHQLGITGYPGKLIEEGYLLLQASFMLWTDNKKDRLRLKGHQRHLFLYQKSILICKKIPKSSLYEFRNKLNLSEVGLTEALKGSGASKKFEIWVNGRQKVYLLQAENVEMKELWVKEIKKLLLEQLESIRTAKSQTIGACGVGIGGPGGSSAAALLQSRRQKMMGSNRGVTMNGWKSSSSSGLLHHRPLRQVCSWDNPEVMASGGSSRPRSRNNQEYQQDIDEDIWSCSEMSNSDDDDNSTTATPPPPHQPPTRPLSMGDEPPGILGGGGIGVLENLENNSGKYVALADYVALGQSEVTLKEGDIVALVKVGCGGWWFVKILHTTSPAIGPMEGWAPSAYLDKFVATTSKGGSSENSSSSSNLSSRCPRRLMESPSSSSQRQGQGSKRSASIPPNSNSTSTTSTSSSSRACSALKTLGQKFSQSTEDLLSALR